MPVREPLTEQETQLIRDLHAAGQTRNDIAREVGRAASTVSVYCKKMGLSFDRSQVMAATEARTADLRSWRTRKLQDLADRVDAELAKFTRPARVYSIGGRENIYTEQLLDEPPADMRYTMARTIGALMDQHLKIAAFDAAKDDHGASDVDAWLESMTAGSGH